MMHNRLIASARRDERNRVDADFIARFNAFKQEAVRLARAGCLDQAAKSYRDASRLAQSVRDATAGASPLLSQTWQQAALLMQSKADAFDEAAHITLRTCYAQALCAPKAPPVAPMQPTPQQQAPTRNLAPQAAAAPPSSEAFDLETASWDAVVARVDGLKAQADQAQSEAVDKMQQAQGILAHAAQAARFSASQHRLAQTWVEETTAQGIAQQGHIAQVRRDAVLAILGFGPHADEESVPSLDEGRSVSVISQVHSTPSSVSLEGYDFVAEAETFAEAPAAPAAPAPKA